MRHICFGGLSCAAACALLAGCVIVPYVPKANVTPVAASLYDAEHTYVTVGPRHLLQDMGKEITDLDPRIRLVDGLALRDALFPNGGWTLSAMLEDSNRPNLANSGADYLVVIGEPKSGKTETVGAFGFYMGFAGAAKSTEHNSIAVMLVDLRQGRILKGADVKADGTAVAVGAFYALIVVPRMDASLHEGVGSAVVQAIRTVRPSGDVRIGVLAMENARKTAEMEAQENAETSRAELRKYAWRVEPSPEDWQAALSRLGPEERAQIIRGSVSLCATGPAVDGTVYWTTDASGPSSRKIVSGIDYLDIPGICDGFNRSFAQGSGAKWEITKALSHEELVKLDDSLHTTRFRLDWVFRDAEGREVPLSETDSGLGAKSEAFHWGRDAKSFRVDTNQAFALTFLKLVLCLQREAAARPGSP